MCRLAAVVAAVLAAAVPIGAGAREDTTPPVLLEFSLRPTRFDAGQADVIVEYCVTARDDRSGLRDLRVQGAGLVARDRIRFPAGDLEQTACGQGFVSRSSPYGTADIVVTVSDVMGNEREYTPRSPQPELDLCGFGPCLLFNREGETPSDSGVRGKYGGAEECRDDARPGQQDTR